MRRKYKTADYFRKSSQKEHHQNNCRISLTVLSDTNTRLMKVLSEIKFCCTNRCFYPCLQRLIQSCSWNYSKMRLCGVHSRESLLRRDVVAKHIERSLMKHRAPYGLTWLMRSIRISHNSGQLNRTCLRKREILQWSKLNQDGVHCPYSNSVLLMCWLCGRARLSFSILNSAPCRLLDTHAHFTINRNRLDCTCFMQR